MKIKIIDLLTKIANQEEPLRKIKWNYHVYIYDEQYDDYYEETTALFENEMSNGMLFKSLNDYVEIIEEKPKYIEKKEIDGEYWLPSKELTNDYEFKKYVLDDLDGRNETIEELRIAVNYLLKKEDE